MTDAGLYEGWTYFDGCAVCPRCNAFIPCGNDIPSILAAIPGHDCRADPGTGHYLRPPDVPAEGWYWIEADGTRKPVSGQFGLPLP